MSECQLVRAIAAKEPRLLIEITDSLRTASRLALMQFITTGKEKSQAIQDLPQFLLKKNA